ncbi:MAG: DedA family protein [Bacteroidales bacterium]|nr:DedA family protein [Bacteroidales bacterium]MBR5532968.1 DedA family protein [Bacteroidales bacterium]
MDIVAQFSEWGYIGLFIASFISGTVLPLCSEAVLIFLVSAGYDTAIALSVATIGNSLGGATCYYLGRLGKLSWIEKYLKIKPEKLNKGTRFVQKGPGAVVAFLSFLPIWGELIIVALGYMRANVLTTNISMLLGKFIRYVCVIKGVEFFM